MFGIFSVTGKVDLHTHTIISDGSDTPEELLLRVKAAGISVFSVTDHDSVKAAGIMRELLREGDPVFISGVEFSCRDEKGKYHILGYGFDGQNAAVQSVVDYGHSLRMKKVLARLEFLKSEFGFCFSGEDVDNLLSLDNPGKPHIGNLMVKYGFAANLKDAIDGYINRIHFKSEYVSPKEAIDGILAGGGIPVLAHPFYGSGDELIMGADMEKRIARLTGYGLRGIEAFYSGFTDKLRKEALLLADKHDLLVTAGSDYHGKNKLVHLGDTGLPVKKEYPERLRRFLSEALSNR